MSSVPYLVSTSDLASGQSSLSRLPQPTTALDRQVILGQLSLVCTSVQMLAETLTTAYVSAVEPSASPGIAQRLNATRVANPLDYLTVTLKTLAESLLAANEIVEEPPRTVDEDEEGRAARDTGRVTTESGAFTPLSISTKNVTLELREYCVCIDEKLVQEFLKATDSCNHILNICSECVQLWLQASIEENIWSRLGCMGCGELLQHADWQRLASAELFERYDDLVMKQALDESPDFRHCLNPECNSGHEHIPGPEPTLAALFVCNDCDYQSCATHNIPWHEGESCEEYNLRLNPAAQEAASIAEIAKVSKACPGTGTTPCGVRVIKDGGCTGCRHQFCYFCFAIWDEYYTDHEPDCDRDEEHQHGW